ncbi:hypothetical protein L7F22_028725, partial [Adiantum nelumboides]|nr:hypothetical protein [Adiantum nelumboides]
MQKEGLEQKINKIRSDYGLIGVIQIEASIYDGALLSILTMFIRKLHPFQVVETPMYIQLMFSMADRLNGHKNEQKRQLGEVKVQLQEKRDPCLRNEGHFSTYTDFYRKLDQLNKELKVEVLKTSLDSDPREVDYKEVEATAITKMLSKASVTTDSGWLKEDLDSLQEDCSIIVLDNDKYSIMDAHVTTGEFIKPTEAVTMIYKDAATCAATLTTEFEFKEVQERLEIMEMGREVPSVIMAPSSSSTNDSTIELWNAALIKEDENQK